MKSCVSLFLFSPISLRRLLLSHLILCAFFSPRLFVCLFYFSSYGPPHLPISTVKGQPSNGGRWSDVPYPSFAFARRQKRNAICRSIVKNSQLVHVKLSIIGVQRCFESLFFCPRLQQNVLPPPSFRHLLLLSIFLKC